MSSAFNALALVVVIAGIGSWLWSRRQAEETHEGDYEVDEGGRQRPIKHEAGI